MCPPRDYIHHILPQGLIKWERLETSEHVRHGHKLHASNVGARISHCRRQTREQRKEQQSRPGRHVGREVDTTGEQLAGETSFECLLSYILSPILIEVTCINGCESGACYPTRHLCWERFPGVHSSRIVPSVGSLSAAQSRDANWARELCVACRSALLLAYRPDLLL